jgi:hypothetical protein
MDIGLQRILGMLDDKKRIYCITESREVAREEFEYCRVMAQVVFGEKGYVETLGPTWNLVHDPRFNRIENAFVIHRQAIFGGDADLGKQYITDDGSTTNADLEQYSEILGEGRFFHTILTHPNTACPVRKWLERIQQPHGKLKPPGECSCCFEPENMPNPKGFKDLPDAELWKYIRQESPNYFTQTGSPNREALRLFELFRADLIGLIEDYAITPLVDDYIALEVDDVVTDYGAGSPMVHVEVDILERALTCRASLRATAIQVLRDLNFDEHLTKLTSDKEFNLTDCERDELLQIVYSSQYPDEKAALLTELTNFILSTLSQGTFEERQARQLSFLQDDSKLTITGLQSGTVEPITHDTEEQVDESKLPGWTEEARIIASIQRNPYKQELYLKFAEAERENNVAVIDLLTPIVMSADFEVDDQVYRDTLAAIANGARSLPARPSAERGSAQIKVADVGAKGYEGEFHSKDSYRKGDGRPVDPVTGEPIGE